MELEDTSAVLKECVREFDQTFARFYIKDSTTGRPGSDESTNDPISDEKSEPETPPVENTPPPFEEPFKVKPKKHSKQKLKKLYKNLSVQTHPDKGGNEEDFLLVGKYYEDGNLLGLLELAEKYNVPYKIDPADDDVFEQSVKKLEQEIFRMKDTLAWNWVKGDVRTKLNIVKVIERETKRKINPNEVIPELQDKSNPQKEILKLNQNNA